MVSLISSGNELVQITCCSLFATSLIRKIEDKGYSSSSPPFGPQAPSFPLCDTSGGHLQCARIPPSRKNHPPFLRTRLSSDLQISKHGPVSNKMQIRVRVCKQSTQKADSASPKAGVHWRGATLGWRGELHYDGSMEIFRRCPVSTPWRGKS